MSYCQQLSKKLIIWQDNISTLEQAKNTYLASFSDEHKQDYQTALKKVKQAQEDYKRCKEECFVEIEIGDTKENLFGPEYDALKKIFDACDLDFTNKDILGRIIKVSQGRIEQFYLTNITIKSDTKKEFQHKTQLLNNIIYFNKLKELYCSYNPQLTQLPELPANLQTLNCYNNPQLTQLPELPANLQTLNCYNNPQLTQLPELPANLKELDCSRSPIDKETIKIIKKHKNYNPNTFIF